MFNIFHNKMLCDIFLIDLLSSTVPQATIVPYSEITIINFLWIPRTFAAYINIHICIYFLFPQTMAYQLYT